MNNLSTIGELVGNLSSKVKKIIYIGGVVVLIGLITVFVLLFAPGLGFKDKLPEVRTAIGVISELGEDSFNIQAKASQNYFAKDASLTILVDSQTEYYRTISRTTLTEEEAEQPSFSLPEDITFMDLVVGDQVVVVSKKNIRDKTELLAESIEVLEIDKIESYTGTITAFVPDGLKVLAKADDNYLNQDTTLLVQVDENTQYFTFVLSEDPASLEGFEQQAISLGKLKIGKEIIVSSGEDLKGITEFLAKEILFIPSIFR